MGRTESVLAGDLRLLGAGRDKGEIGEVEHG